MQALLNNCLITRVLNESAGAQTALSSSVLDMEGFDSVLFIILLGTVTDGSVMTAVIKSNPTNSSSGGTAEVTGDSKTASTSSNLTMAVECLRPTQRYVFCYITRTTDNAEVNGIIAVQYNSRNVPQTQTILDAVLGGPNA